MRQDDVWDREAAARYSDDHAEMYAADVLTATVDRLVALAGSGRALELAIGTGRVALPLAGRGVPVVGIELSSAMVEELRAQADADDVPVVLGDMTTAQAPGEFALVCRKAV